MLEPVDARSRRIAKRRDLLEHELARLVKELVRRGATLIVLIGSLARQDISPTSDIDLIVVGPWSGRFLDRLLWLEDELRPRVAADILAYTPGEFEEIRKRAFFVQALAEGKVLYASEPSC